MKNYVNSDPFRNSQYATTKNNDDGTYSVWFTGEHHNISKKELDKRLEKYTQLIKTGDPDLDDHYDPMHPFQLEIGGEG